jgi:subtilisin-like proprotein convertase family protein
MSAMFADTKNPSMRRSGAPRRTLLGRASLLAAMSVLTLGLTVAEPLVAAKPHSKQAQEEKKGGKTITRTFSSPNAVVINDDIQADPYPSAIVVSGIKKGKVKDVNVTLRGYNHGFPDNVDVMLVAPDGSSTVLMSDSGGATDAASLTLKFDDQASGTTPDGSTIESGTFKPVNYGAGDAFPLLGAAPATVGLAQLNGGNPNGEWLLYVVDDTATSVGAFSGGWDMELTAKLAKKKKQGGKN